MCTMINRFSFFRGSLCLGIILYCPEKNVAGDNGLPRRYFVIVVEAVSACAYDSGLCLQLASMSAAQFTVLFLRTCPRTVTSQ
uniref:Putative secreted protein n=1 Tax=Ixodes ricinus TaxID=34613 RepID=A0A6B0UE73_IXORI